MHAAGCASVCRAGAVSLSKETDMPPQPIEIVQSVYADFARGDVAAIVERFHPEAQLIVHAPESIPYGGTRNGPEEIERWFGELAATVAIEQLEGETMIASGDQVAVRGIEAGRSTATGRCYRSGFVHFWQIRDGRVVRLDDFVDSAAVAAAIAH
jgi:ketosteroid isomerase-like protein